MDVSALRFVSQVWKWYLDILFNGVIWVCYSKMAVTRAKAFFFLFFLKGRSINNIILGSQVEVISTESVSYGQMTCQKRKVRGCISATAKVEWLWAKYEIVMA